MDHVNRISKFWKSLEKIVVQISVRFSTTGYASDNWKEIILGAEYIHTDRVFLYLSIFSGLHEKRVRINCYYENQTGHEELKTPHVSISPATVAEDFFSFTPGLLFNLAEFGQFICNFCESRARVAQLHGDLARLFVNSGNCRSSSTLGHYKSGRDFLWHSVRWLVLLYIMLELLTQYSALLCNPNIYIAKKNSTKTLALGVFHEMYFRRWRTIRFSAGPSKKPSNWMRLVSEGWKSSVIQSKRKSLIIGKNSSDLSSQWLLFFYIYISTKWCWDFQTFSLLSGNRFLNYSFLPGTIFYFLFGFHYKLIVTNDYIWGKRIWYYLIIERHHSIIFILRNIVY